MDIKDVLLLNFKPYPQEFPNREQSIETIKDIYMWESYPVLMLVKVTKKESTNYIEFGFIMAGLPTIVRLENLLRKKDIDFHDTKNIKSVEYNSIDEMVDNGWRISPTQPHN